MFCTKVCVPSCRSTALVYQDTATDQQKCTCIFLYGKVQSFPLHSMKMGFSVGESARLYSKPYGTSMEVHMCCWVL